jgi:replicative DNA helicase
MSDYRKRKDQGNQPLDFTFGHIMPQATDMEKAVLGALMIDKDAYLEVGELLKPESFYEPRNQMVYAAIQRLSLDENPVDVLTVTNQLEKMGNLEEVGGPSYIAELSSRVASSANVEYHANVVAEKYLARQMINYVGVIGKKTFDDTIDIKDVMDEAEAKLFELSQKNMKKDYSVLAPILKRAVKTVQDAHSNTGGITGISTGFYKLDDITCGWQNSDLVIIAGRPAMGKTAFALSLAKNIAADQNIPMAFFSLEMSSEQLANRLMANAFQIDSKKLMSGQLNRDEWDRLDKCMVNLEDAPLYIDDTEGLSVMELRSKARRMVKEHGVKLIMIDYLQLMTASGMRYNSRQEEVSLISRSLKGLAKELNIPVLALSQLNRGVDSREGPEGKRPLLSDLRESGAIEQDADMVVFLHRPEYYGILMSEDGTKDYQGMAEVIIAKHRKGAVGIKLLKFRGEYTRFENPEDSMLENRAPMDGEIRGSAINVKNNNMPFPPPSDYNPFDVPVKNDY